MLKNAIESAGFDLINGTASARLGILLKRWSCLTTVSNGASTMAGFQQTCPHLDMFSCSTVKFIRSMPLLVFRE
jgi:hypothetical protein